MKISAVLDEIEKYLTHKEYLINESANVEFVKQLEDIMLFLILNCEFRTQFEMDSCAHLMGIMPKLSTCILANIILELNLVSCFIVVCKRIPFNVQEEILREIVPCLKKGTPELCLTNSGALLKGIVAQLGELDDTMDRSIDDVVKLISEILHNLVGLYIEEKQPIKSSKVYQHMGYTFLCLLELLNSCQYGKPASAKFIDHLIGAASIVMQAVTIDVFCVWAEVSSYGYAYFMSYLKYYLKGDFFIFIPMN